MTVQRKGLIASAVVVLIWAIWGLVNRPSLAQHTGVSMTGFLCSIFMVMFAVAEVKNKRRV